MRLFLTARVVSWLGTTMTMVALPVLAYQLTGSPTVLGLVAVAEMVPYLVVGLPAGALVDRWDLRRCVVVTSLVSGVAMATVPVAAAAGVLTTPQLFVVALVSATAFVFFDAAGFAALPALVPRDKIGAATGSLSSAYTLIAMVAPALGGLLIALVGAPAVLAIDAATYAVAAVLLSRLRGLERPPARGSLGARMAEGIAFIRGHAVIRTLTVLGIGNSIAGGAVTALVVVVAVQQLGLDAADPRVGILFSCAAIGSFMAGILVAPLQRRVPVGMLTVFGLALGLVAVLTWSTQSLWWLSGSLLAVVTFANTGVALNGIVVRQTLTPPTLQSRVNTTARIIAWGGAPLGAGMGGALAGWLGADRAVQVCAAALAAALLAGLRGPLRRMGRLADLPIAQDAPSAGAVPDGEQDRGHRIRG